MRRLGLVGLLKICIASFFSSYDVQGGAYILPAICTAGYTVATINNSFDRNLHGLEGFLDSPVSSNLTSFFLIDVR